MVATAIANQVIVRLKVEDERAKERIAGFARVLTTLGTVGVFPKLAAGAADFAQWAAAATERAADLARRADQLGVSAGELDRFTRSARAIAGVDFDQAIDALETFQERVGEAAFEPDSQIAGLFSRIGVDVQDANGAVRRAADVWDDYVAAVAGADAETRSYLAAEFGDAVRDLAGPWSQNADAVRQYQQELRDLAAIDEELVAAAAEANKEWQLLGDTFDVLGTNIANFATSWGSFFARWGAEAAGFVNQAFGGAAVTYNFRDLEHAQAYLAEAQTLLDDLRKQHGEASAASDFSSMLDMLDGMTMTPAGVTGLALHAAAAPEGELADHLDFLISRLEAGTRAAQAYISAAGTGEGATNHLVAQLTHQFQLATTNAQALGAEIEKLRAEGSEPSLALAAYLEQQQRALEQQLSVKDVETDRLALELELVGLSAEEARLATLRRQLAAETIPAERERIEARIAITEQIIAANAAHEEEVALQAAIDDLTARIDRRHYGIAEHLLEELDITREMLAKNEKLAALFDGELALRHEAAEAARDEAVYGDVNRALDEERARAVGLDVRLHRILVDLQREGIRYSKEDIELLRLKLEELDKLAFANNLRDDIKGAVEGGLREGLRDFSEGGDIGDVFDAIGRQLLDTLLDAAIGSFGRSGGPGTGLLGFLGGLFGGGRERGGPVDAGRLYLVGERGPELFMPRSAGQVLAAVAAGPNVTQNITVQGSVRSDADVAAIAQRVAQQSAAGLARAIANGRLGVAA